MFCIFVTTIKINKMQTTKQELLGKLSSHLFWDTDREKLDWEHHCAFIIKRILEYGTMADWNLLRTSISIAEIARIAQTFRDLEPRALAFISAISHTPKEQFRCYTTKQLNRQHWNS